MVRADGGWLRLSALAAASVCVEADFVAQEFLPDTVPCNATLSNAVVATCRGRVFDKAKFDVWAKNLDFEFGMLSERDWQTVRDQYTAPWAGARILAGETPLFRSYNASKAYNLMDFLPATIRALANRNFVEEDEPLPEQPLPSESEQHVYGKSVLVPNCWTTVYETLRTIAQGRSDDPHIFHEVYTTDDKKMLRWMESATELVPGPYTEAMRQFGDVMFISLPNVTMYRKILEHAVMFVDQDVIWEKSGTGPLNPYRLTNLATLEQEWPPNSKGGLFSWELRRPSFDSLPPFAEAWSIAKEEPDPRWPQFWQWPLDLQRTYSLGVADTSDPEVIDALTLLRMRRYGLCQGPGDLWEPCGGGARGGVVFV